MNDENELKLISVLERIKSINDKYNEIDKINGVNFNIFSILNMERNEVNTHSNFIFELLNPDGLHNKGDVFLKLFFKKVLGLDYDTNIRSTQVVQEDTTIENRRIDFTIETEQYQIGIEMKIDAKDQKHQLFDYYAELKHRKKNDQEVQLFYLTLNGKEPDQNSIRRNGNILDIDREFKLISFEFHIINWLNECIKESATNTTIREALIQYLNLVNKITNKSNSEGRKKEMTDLFKNSENLKAYLEAEDDVLEIKIELQCRFWNALEEKLHDENLPFEFNDTNNSTNIKEAVEKYYKNKKYNKGYEYTLVFESVKNLYFVVTVDNDVYYEIVSTEGNNALISKIEERKIWDVTEKNNCKLVKKLNFNDMLDTPNVLEFYNEQVLNKVIEELVEEIKDIKHKIDLLIKQI